MSLLDQSRRGRAKRKSRRVRNAPKATAGRQNVACRDVPRTESRPWIGQISVDLGQGQAAGEVSKFTMANVHSLPEKWLPVSIAPLDIDLEVCVMDNGAAHALIFPVRRNKTDWVDAKTKKRIDIMPTHWRMWNDNQ